VKTISRLDFSLRKMVLLLQAEKTFVSEEDKSFYQGDEARQMMKG
jgi:hypothetical protein